MTNDPSKAAVTESNEEFIARMKATCIAAGMQDAQPDPVYLLVPFNLEETQRLWQHELMLMQRAERAEAELAIYRKLAEVEIADLRDDVKRHIQIVSEAEAGRDAALKDAESAKAALKAQATEAYADVDEWAAYASEYFRAKWDLHGTLQKWRVRFEPDAARKGEQ